MDLDRHGADHPHRVTATSLLKLIEQSVFFALGIAATVHWFRRRTPGAAWLALTFGSLSIDILLGLTISSPAAALRHMTLVRVVIISLALFPYWLYRFGSSFQQARR